MNGKRIIVDHDFYCTCCGKKGIPISRDKRKIRECGHLKRIYCIFCNKEVNHVEVIENTKYDKSTFIDEYNSGNFDKEGNRVIPLKEWIVLYYGSSESKDEELVEDGLSVDEWLTIFHNDFESVMKGDE